LKDVAAQLRGFGPVGLLALFIILAGNLVVVPLSGVLVLVWAQLSQTPLQTLGFTAPRRWTRTLAIGIPFGVALKLVMKAIVMPLFGAGFGEETVFRGFFFERLGKLLGTRPAALAATVVLTSGLFALAHYWDQGLPADLATDGRACGVRRDSRRLDLLGLGVGGRTLPVPIASA